MSAEGMTASASQLLIAALDDTYFVPQPHRREEISESEAQQILGCDRGQLDMLVADGLPTSVIDGVRRFDQCDLFNLALRAGAGTTAPELAFRFALRWMSESTEQMLTERQWAFSVDARCPVDAQCTGDTALAVPFPQCYGGALTFEGPPVRVDAEGRTHSGPTGAVTIDAEISLAGALTEINDATIRDIYGSFLAQPPRWVKLPAELHADIARLEPRNVATCVSASLALARDFTRAGRQARTRRGWVLGMLDLVHAWVEVEQSDGTVTVIDPIFALFSTLLTTSNPTLCDPRVSVRCNRVLPTHMSARQPLATHRCAHTDAEAAAKIHARIAPQPKTTA